jgi:hypothetical protein
MFVCRRSVFLVAIVCCSRCLCHVVELKHCLVVC